jgi:hypothetical protein
VVLAKQFTQQSYMWEFPAQYGLWSPANITTALWLDAADTSTVTTVSGAVSEWQDKSGNGRNAVQGAAANRPVTGTATLNGLNVIRYDATNDFLSLANATGLTVASTFYFFGVRRSSVAASADTDTSRPFLSGVTGAYVIGNDTSIALTGETTVFLVGPNNPRVGANAANYSRAANSAELYAVFGTSSTNVVARINGTEIVSYLSAGLTNRSDPAACSPALTGFDIGGSGSSSNGAIVDFAEMLVLTTAPSLLNIQKIEGYLAHKWGLTANLPAGHPYKTVGPTP